MPEKTPVNAVVHGAVQREGYTVERVYLESVPGFYVTGSLYRPTNKPGRLQAVLCPHGHWSNGRFHDHGEAGLRREIEQGAEKFDPAGRYPLQSRCVQLARMGCIVFHYDMIGYADSQQISSEVAHRIRNPRPHMEANQEGWGLFSTMAELRQQNVMGLQTLGSIRALDWLLSRDDVDATRIGVTGASGGGTQTFMLAAVDPRPAVAFPAVMVSTAMQGGCTCENAPLLRVGTGNIEIAGLFAPKPLGLTAADDWTHEIATKGLPELRQLYQLLGAPDKIHGAPLTQFKHNYNAVSRAVMYEWFNRHLGLKHSSPAEEQDYKPLSAAEMTVWNDQHPQPEGGEAFERRLLRQMADASDRRIAALAPHDAASLARYREVVGGAFEAIFRRSLPDANDIEREKVHKQDAGDYFVVADLLRVKSAGEELPVVFLHPKQWNGRVVLWFSGKGKEGLFTSDGAPRKEIQTLLDARVSVASADLLHQGEFLTNGEPLTETPKVKNPRGLSCFTEGYNDTLFVRRVHDILTVIAFVKNDEHAPKAIDLAGVDGAGPLAAAAGFLAGDAVDRIAVDTRGFRFAELHSFRDPNFLPGAVKYGDTPALLALCAPHRLGVVGERGKLPPSVVAAYQAAGAQDSATALDAALNQSGKALTAWLLKP
jgi:dienelactone hydrolase